MRSPLLLVLFFAWFPGLCRATSGCPWINQATALGALGTREDLPGASAETGPASCYFAYHDGKTTRELRITVEDAAVPERAWMAAMKTQCGARRMVLRAIGNEAIMCWTGRYGTGARVLGRVRDKIFTIDIKTSEEKASEMSEEILAEKARLVAEQVSGNLF
ncbi:MAG: hypothetical protein QJR10_01015 [Bacillota bacterium]|nr:hypothetical protein [Bacillota bacterium]